MTTTQKDLASKAYDCTDLLCSDLECLADEIRESLPLFAKYVTEQLEVAQKLKGNMEIIKRSLK